MKRKIVPGTLSTKDLHQYIIGSIAPRPIAFVSTMGENGVHNLAPYSFFNAFSSNPPILVFSSNRKATDNTTKDTLHNVRVSGECVVNVVPYSIVRQMSLASVEYPADISEFDETGLTREPSETVKCPRVMESPVNLECTVKDIITLGEHGGAGHLIICEVNLIAISESVLIGDRIDPNKLDLVGRLGKQYYVRASGAALIEIPQSVSQIPLGFLGLPEKVRTSKVLTGNELATLASLYQLPDADAIAETKARYPEAGQEDEKELHWFAARLIHEGKPQDALSLLM